MPSSEDLQQAAAVTRPPRHHFFGYYDKFPWDATGRYLLSLQTQFIDRPPNGADRAVIGLIDLQDNNRWRALDETTAWCWQQGTMLQWLGTASDRLIIYNQRSGDRFVSVIRDVKTGETRTLPLPVYAVTRDGKSAISVNFARLARVRPGYGYTGLPDPFEDDNEPEQDGLFSMDLTSGAHRLVVSTRQMARLNPVKSMTGAKHRLKHVQYNPDGTRFVFLHRWKLESVQWPWYTRMYTANADGSDLCFLAGDECVSHFDWKNSRQILAWAKHDQAGTRFYLFTDRTRELEVLGEGVLTEDGHCLFSPDGRWLLSDTYPDKQRMRTLILFRLSDGKRFDVGRFFAPAELDGEIRCDLHPRWSRDGKQVCFDSVHEGSRQVYVLDVAVLVGR